MRWVDGCGNANLLAVALELETLAEAPLAWQARDGAIRTQAWHGCNADGAPTPTMPTGECIALVHRLQSAVAKGNTILTWNGLSFDFDVLAEESGLHAECAALALGHIDQMYHFLCLKGYPLSLDAAAQGLGLPGKAKDVTGAQAPTLWAEGKHAEVLAYVARDARTTLEVALAVQRRRGLRWITKAGRASSVPLPRWLTVAEARNLPLPDTSWMTKPLERAVFEGWMKHNEARIS